jgi:Holliday junction resolvase RusA-like endonuclease
MAPWIDSATFEDVVSSREEKTGKRDIDDLVKAVEYYLENDDFMD